MNPFQMLGAIKNPQAFIQNAMNNTQIMQNPMAKNAIEMYKQGDNAGLQQLAENLCKEKGTTPEEIKNGIMQQFGLK